MPARGCVLRCRARLVTWCRYSVSLQHGRHPGPGIVLVCSIERQVILRQLAHAVNEMLSSMAADAHHRANGHGPSARLCGEEVDARASAADRGAAGYGGGSMQEAHCTSPSCSAAKLRAHEPRLGAWF